MSLVACFSLGADLKKYQMKSLLFVNLPIICIFA